MTKLAKRIKVCSLCARRFCHPRYKVGQEIYCGNQIAIIEAKSVELAHITDYPVHIESAKDLGQATGSQRVNNREYFSVSDWNSDSEAVNKLLRYLRYRKSASEASRENACQIVVRLCKFANMKPDDLVKLPREKIEELVQTWTDKKAETTSNGNANLLIRWAKTFFRVNGFNKENNNELRLHTYYQAPRERIRKQHVPFLKEALCMAERARSKRDRAIIYTLLSTGLRNSTLRAINVGDVREELQKGQLHLLIKVVPELKERVPDATKGRIPYYVFTSVKATEVIKSYLKEREEAYGYLDDNEPLFITKFNHLPFSMRRKYRLSSSQLLTIIKRCAKEADIKDWERVDVHAFRKTLKGVLRNPLSDGTGLDPEDQEFLMGHILRGSQDKYYDWSQIEELRKKYAKLVFENAPAFADISRQTFRRIAKYMGIDVDRILADKKKSQGSDLSADEEEKLIGEVISQRGQDSEKYEFKTIHELELEKHLREGWQPVHEMKDGNIIVKKQISANKDPLMQSDTNKDKQDDQPSVHSDGDVKTDTNLEGDSIKDAATDPNTTLKHNANETESLADQTNNSKNEGAMDSDAAERKNFPYDHASSLSSDKTNGKSKNGSLDYFL